MTNEQYPNNTQQPQGWENSGWTAQPQGWENSGWAQAQPQAQQQVPQGWENSGWAQMQPQQGQPQGWENSGWAQAQQIPQQQAQPVQGWENTNWQQPQQFAQGDFQQQFQQPQQAFTPQVPTKPAKPNPLADFFAGVFDFACAKSVTKNFGTIFILGTMVSTGLWWILTAIKGLIAISEYSSVTYILGSVVWLLTGWVFPVLAGALARMVVEIHRDSQEAREAHRAIAEKKEDDADKDDKADDSDKSADETPVVTEG